MVDEIEELNDEREEFGDAISEIMSEADTGIDTIITDKSLGAISKMSRGQASGASSKISRGQASGIEKAKQFVEKSREHAEKKAAVTKELNKEEATVNSTARMITDQVLKNEVDWLKDALANAQIQGDLLKYMEFNINTDLSFNPWKKIGNTNTLLYNELKQVKKGKTGRGLACGCKSVKFLPDNKKDLSHELIRLMGSYKSGNKAVINELNAVVDELRRKGMLTLEQ